MKQLQIGIVISDKGKIAIAKKKNGFSSGISSELEILGIFQTLVSFQQEKIKCLQSEIFKNGE